MKYKIIFLFAIVLFAIVMGVLMSIYTLTSPLTSEQKTEKEVKARVIEILELWRQGDYFEAKYYWYICKDVVHDTIKDELENPKNREKNKYLRMLAYNHTTHPFNLKDYEILKVDVHLSKKDKDSEDFNGWVDVNIRINSTNKGGTPIEYIWRMKLVRSEKHFNKWYIFKFETL